MRIDWMRIPGGCVSLDFFADLGSVILYLGILAVSARVLTKAVLYALDFWGPRD